MSAGSGYISGDICLQGNSSGGYGFYGTFDVYANNGTLRSLTIVEHGVNYLYDPTDVGLCFHNSHDPQVRIESNLLILSSLGYVHSNVVSCLM